MSAVMSMAGPCVAQTSQVARRPVAVSAQVFFESCCLKSQAEPVPSTCLGNSEFGARLSASVSSQSLSSGV